MIAVLIVVVFVGALAYIFGPIFVAPKDANGYVIDKNYDPKNPPKFAPIPTMEEIRTYTGDRPRTVAEIAAELPEPEEVDVA